MSLDRKPSNNWKNTGGKTLERTFEFADFREALEFVNKVGKIAEEEGHHPDISIFSYNKVKITLITHSIGALSENDFILAAKVDTLLK